MKLLATITAALLAATALATMTPAFQSRGESSPTLDSARARWERLTPAEKERMRERYEQYKGLSEEQRRGLVTRARSLHDEKERVQSELTQDAREKIRNLDPEKRREVIKDLVEGEAREKGARIREKMPEAWIERLEQARPEDRARFLAEFQRKSRERVAQGAIDKIGKRLNLPKEEIERLKSLPEAERANAVLALRQKLSARDAAEFGLPAGISQAQWDEWQKLPPEQFFEVMQRYRRERAADRPAPEKSHLVRNVEAAMRSTREEVVGLADLAVEVRRQRLFELRRDRVLNVLRASGEFPPERIRELERLPEPMFVRTLRALLQPRVSRYVRPGETLPAGPSRPTRD